jgi:hypothetical protein
LGDVFSEVVFPYMFFKRTSKQFSKRENLMKKVTLLLLVMVFLATVSINAQEQTTGGDSRVYCCHEKGKCDKLHTKAECEKEGGKVVNNCKECK